MPRARGASSRRCGGGPLAWSPT
uniref:Uncharacterized protein n=1 Tax=Arundo donax TaxID=35708 RepID=A0A0A9CBP3_ARUDO